MVEEWTDALVRVSSLLIESRDYKKTLRTIVEQSAQLSGACRACVVIENTSGAFVVKAGYPEEGHGIDTILTPELGEEFLKGVIKRGEIEVIENPKEDERTRYMEGLARVYDLAKIIFLPLVYHGDSLGALILDFQEDLGETSVIRMEKVKLLANLASSAIGAEYERRRNEKKILRMERMNAIGEQVAGIAHTLRNGLDIKIGAWARRMEKKLAVDEDPECLSVRESLEQGISVIVKEVGVLERFVNDLLSFATPEQTRVEPTFLNQFLREKMGMIFEIRSELDLDEVFEEMPVAIDRDLMSVVIDDLVKNAIQAKHHERELVITVRTRYSRKRGCAFIHFINNGEEIENGFMDDIFSPFFTTKADGTGLGLPHAKAALTRHGGDIRLIESTDERTIFEIVLPV